MIRFISIVFAAFRTNIRFESLETCQQLIVSSDGFAYMPDETIDDEHLEDQDQDHHGKDGE